MRCWLDPDDRAGRTPARRWEPKRLRLRLFTIAARLARDPKRTHLRLPSHHPWTELFTTALARLNTT
ncbi:transposase [Nocardia fluminea]|uniref:transposase n=1 Tax=Nocardia fluminea TaxID=134984 RepID=UPI0033E55F5F